MRNWRGLVGVGLALAGAVFQLLIGSQPLNDHFVLASLGREMLFGHFPVRDFFEPGAPLWVALSAGAQAIDGYRLLADALVAAVSLGITIWCIQRAGGHFRGTNDPVLEVRIRSTPTPDLASR